MASANPYRYAGYRYDEVTRLYYLMARYYDSGVGRFITRDSFQGTETYPLSLNQYAYTENNPIVGIDPDDYSTRWTHLYQGLRLLKDGCGDWPSLISYISGSEV